MKMCRQIVPVREGSLLAGFVPDKFFNWMWMYVDFCVGVDDFNSSSQTFNIKRQILFVVCSHGCIFGKTWQLCFDKMKSYGFHILLIED